MPTTEYPKNPNVDTAFVTDDNNKRNRALKTVLVDGTIDYPSNSNSTGCYVTIDGKKQRAMMTADISSAGTLEYPENSNSTKGYVDINGKKQRVILTAAIAGGGSAPVIDELNVTPSTSAQTITAPEGVDGYSPVNVSAVDSTIDANIVAGNIKKDVQILGVTGSYEGQTPTGSINITANGIYDVTNYASADVQVPTTAPAHYIEKAVDANGKLIGSSTLMDFTGVTDVGNFVLSYTYYTNTSMSGAIDMSNLTTLSGQYACQSMFFGCTGITSVDLSGLTTLSGTYCCYQTFYECTGITSVDLSGLTTLSGQSTCTNMFFSCTGLTSVDLSSLTTVSGSQACQSMFQNCNGIPSIVLSSLTTLSGYQACQRMFRNCNRITSIVLSSLTTLSGSNACQQMFQGCQSLTTLSFPSLTSNSFGSYTNQFNNMLQGVTGCTVHFPSNLQSVIGSWSDVTAGFGGTNTTVLYDLPATVTLTGADAKTYKRNPKYDTATALGWYEVGTDRFTTQVYTSGTTDPAVSDTIYSDAACTNAVTTIDSIA